MKLEPGTVAFITGAGSGFGLESAIHLYSFGCSIVLGDINYTAEAQEFIKNSDPSRILQLTLDVTNEANVKEVVEKAVARFHKIDILLNSAGVVTLGPTANRFNVMDNQDLTRVWNINVMGTINVSKWVAFHMIKQEVKDRVIVNIGSIAGLDGTRGVAIYGGTKGAIHAITLPMARDLGRYNIRVVAVAPQIFNTPMGKMNGPHQSKVMAEHTALQRLGEPKEFAQCLESIATCSYINGVVIRLDGGIRAPHL